MRRRHFGWCVTACMVAVASGSARAFDWQTTPPERVGLSRSALDAMRANLERRGTQALLIIRHDQIGYEWYASGAGRNRRHYTASLAKALVGGTSLALAISDGLLGPDDPAWRYIRAWKNDPRRARITIRHLATHSAGIEDADIPGTAHADLPGWKGAFWRREPDPFSIARDQAPVVFDPGSQFAYSNTGMAMLAYAVTASLRATKTPDLRSFLRERIMTPIGVPDAEWSIGYGRTYTVDGLPLVANWGGGGYSPNAVARVGRLFLHAGRWEDRQLIRRAVVEQVLKDAGTPTPARVPPEGPFPRSGLAWYVNRDGVWPEVPRDAFAGAGAGNQVLLVVPSLDLIVVRNGGQLEANNFWGGLEKHLFNPIMAAIQPTATSAIPVSPVIRGIAFGPVESTIRRAVGSDNWPITWGDDDALYTVYGDGWGFEPRTEEKLSQGFARITGRPSDFHGVNIRSPSGERLGDGANGPKASGLLMVEGVLYMWVRNTGNATLAWSDDRGRSWEWGFRLTESFGCPTFLNYGRNYAGARDEYVYVYSSDGPSAYVAYDHVVLARMPKGRIRDRSAYQFFRGLDAAGHPTWTDDSAERGPILSRPGGCERIDVAYHPELGRYLMALSFNHAGGWGLFDAPTPWGPWTRAFVTRDWGLNDTHGYRLPSKWLDSEARVGWMVFSGRGQDDAFCVRSYRILRR